MTKTKGSKNRRSYLLDVAKKMPPLFHKLPNEDFDINKSEMVQWLVQQPDILNYLVNRIKGGNQYIVYDPSTGKWQGVDYKEPIHDGTFSNCEVCDNHTCEEGYCSWDL